MPVLGPFNDHFLADNFDESKPSKFRDVDFEAVEERVAVEEAREVANAIEALQDWIKSVENQLGAREGHPARWTLPRLVLFGAFGGSFAFGSKHEVELPLRPGSVSDFVDRVEQYLVSNPETDALKTLGLDAQGNVAEPGWKP